MIDGLRKVIRAAIILIFINVRVKKEPWEVKVYHSTETKINVISNCQLDPDQFICNLENYLVKLLFLRNSLEIAEMDGP